MSAFIRRSLFPAALALAAACFLPALAQQPPVSAPVPRREKVTITLNSRNVYFLNGKRVRENQIEPLLAARVRKNSRVVAIIRCDKRQTVGRVTKLLDLVKQAGVQSMMIAAPSTVSTLPHVHSVR